MYKRRYGCFHPKDFLSSWIVLLFFSALTAAGILLRIHWLFCVLPSVAFLIRIITILCPFAETFTIQDDRIETRRMGRHLKDIQIPHEVTAVLCQADVRVPMNSPDPLGVCHHSHLLDGQYMLILLHDVSAETVFTLLKEQKEKQNSYFQSDWKFTFILRLNIVLPSIH